MDRASHLLALEKAEQRMNGLEKVVCKTGAAQATADALGKARASVELAWQDAREADTRADAALRDADACLSALRSDLAALDEDRHAADEVVTRSLDAVEVLARAPSTELATAAVASDAAFAERRAAERRLQDRQRSVLTRARTCRYALDAADWAADVALTAQERFAEQTRDLPSVLQQVRCDWDAAVTEEAAALQARWLAAASAPLLLPPGDRLARLVQAVQSPSMSAPHTDSAALETVWHNDDLARKVEELAQARDAAAYIDLVAGPQAPPCRHEPCPSFSADRQALAARIAAARTTVRAIAAQLAAASPALETALAPLRAALQDHFRAVLASEPALLPALDEAGAASRAAAEAADEMKRRADAAYAAAKSDWEAAYRLAWGIPPSPPEASGDSARGSAAAVSLSAASAQPPPDLRNHAYALFQVRDSEPDGFGAYTYVLVRSAGDLRVPAVRQRLLALIDTLSRQPPADMIESAMRPLVNLFCIPSRADGDDPRAVVDGFLPDLSQQVWFHAQSGLLTRDDLRQRLTNSPGPFLLTLPSRLAATNSGNPLLLADLSRYSEDTVADLAAQYMNGLIDDFPRSQERWRPPRVQSVALTLIWLSSQAGRVLADTAEAASPPSGDQRVMPGAASIVDDPPVRHVASEPPAFPPRPKADTAPVERVMPWLLWLVALAALVLLARTALRLLQRRDGRRQ